MGQHGFLRLNSAAVSDASSYVVGTPFDGDHTFVESLQICDLHHSSMSNCPRDCSKDDGMIARRP
jgi:hypothetical protein